VFSKENVCQHRWPGKMQKTNFGTDRFHVTSCNGSTQVAPCRMFKNNHLSMYKKYFFWCCLLVLSATGCFVQKQKVTRDEAIAFAKDLAASVAIRNPNVFNNIFDADALKKKMLEASDGKLSYQDLAEIPEALKKRRMGDEIVDAAKDGGMYEPVKFYEKNDTQHVIFRLYGNSGLNYHDISLVHSGKDIKAADIYFYLTSEDFSKSLADISVQLKNYLDPGNNIISIINKIKKYRQNDENEKALELFNQLPDSLRHQKIFQLVHIQLTANLDDEHTKALDEFQKLFPNEPGMFITALDIHMSHQEYDKALTDINKMDSIINKDTFLDYYRGLMYKELKDTAASISCFENLYKNFPSFGAGIIELIAADTKSGQIDKAKKLVTVYRDNKKLNQENMDYILIKYPQLVK